MGSAENKRAALGAALRKANVELFFAVQMCGEDAAPARGLEHISAELQVLLDGLFPEDDEPAPLVICPDCLSRVGERLTPEMNSEQLIIRLLRPVQVGGRTWMPADFEPPAGSAIWRSPYEPNHLCVSNGRHRLQPSPLCKLPAGSFEVLVERVST
jgi:hypothetical protein